MSEIYISTDIEADGPIPGTYSMLSFACAAFNLDGQVIDTFERNLECLPNAEIHPDTMEFWSRFPEAYKRTRENTVNPIYAMYDLNLWLKNLKGIPIFVGFPGAWDFMWMFWYTVEFTGEYGPFGYAGLDAKSFAMAHLKIPFSQSQKRNFPKEWFNPLMEHTHVALDDAIEQGHMFINMLRESRKNEI